MPGSLRAVYYALVLSIPFETVLFLRGDGAGMGVSITRILGILLFALAVAHRDVCFRSFPAAFWLVAWYMAAFTLSQLWIPGMLDGRFRELQTTMLQSGALFLISANLLVDARFRERLLRVYGWGVAVVALLMLVGPFAAEFDKEGRGSLLTQNPNLTAALFAIGAICLAGDRLLLTPGARALRLLPSLAAVGVLLMAVLRTGSRSGLLAVTGGLLALAACGGRTTRLARSAAAVVVLVIGGVLLGREFANSTTTAARLERSWYEGDTAGRTGIYDAAWNMFVERPLLGYGGANNRFILGTDLNRLDYRGRTADRDTHSTYLAVLTEVGLVGGLPFIAALALALWGAWRFGRRTGDPVPFAMLAALLIMNAFVTGMREKMFWIVLAAAVAAGRQKGDRHAVQ